MNSYNFDQPNTFVTIRLEGDKNQVVFEKKGSPITRVVSLGSLTE